MEDIEQELSKAERIKYKTAPVRGMLVSGLILFIILFTKNPGNGGPQLIIAFLFVLFCFMICVFSLILQFLWLILGAQKDRSAMRLIYSSVILAFGSVFLIGLQTLGQLRVIDVVLVTIFETVLIFYTLRRF